MGKPDRAIFGSDRYCPNCGRGYTASTYTCPYCNLPTASANVSQTHDHTKQTASPTIKRILLICSILLVVFAVSRIWNHGNYNRFTESIGAESAITNTNIDAKTLGNWKISVTGYEFAETITSGVNRYFDSGAGKTFLLIYIDAKNTGKSKETFIPHSFTDADLSCNIALSKGEKTESYGVTQLIDYMDDATNESVSSQKSVSGIIAFIVSSDLKRPDTIKLIFSQNYQEAIFELK